MNKYKVIVYAICKNEEKYVDKWYDSVKEADKIFVLDTGSTDNTIRKLKEKDKVVVKEEKIIPWRLYMKDRISTRQRGARVLSS